jgi:hypothetical protein
LDQVWVSYRSSAVLILNVVDRVGEEVSRFRPARPVEPLEFWLVSRTEPLPAVDFNPPLRLQVKRNMSGYHLFFGRVRGMASQPGDDRRVALENGLYRLRITSPAGIYQPFEMPVRLPLPNLNRLDPSNPNPLLRNPLDGYTARLEPGFAYPFGLAAFRPADPANPCDPTGLPRRRGPSVLRGGLHNPDGRGRAGAVITATGSDRSARTDERGLWALWFPAADGVVLPHNEDVRIDLGGGIVVDPVNVCVVPGYETSLPETVLTGRVLRRGVPVRGAVIDVAGFPGESITRTDGSWTYYFPPDQADTNVDLTVTLPDGSSQTRNGIAITSRATAPALLIHFP